MKPLPSSLSLKALLKVARQIWPARRRNLHRPPGQRDRRLQPTRVQRHGGASRVDPRQSQEHARIFRLISQGRHENPRLRFRLLPGGAPDALPRKCRADDRSHDRRADCFRRLRRGRRAPVSHSRERSQRGTALARRCQRVVDALDLRDQGGGAMVARATRPSESPGRSWTAGSLPADTTQPPGRSPPLAATNAMRRRRTTGDGELLRRTMAKAAGGCRHKAPRGHA